jgi:hypothetical protein
MSISIFTHSQHMCSQCGSSSVFPYEYFVCISNFSMRVTCSDHLILRVVISTAAPFRKLFLSLLSAPSILYPWEDKFCILHEAKWASIRSDRCWDRKHLLHLPEIEMWLIAVVSILNELSNILLNKPRINKRIKSAPRSNKLWPSLHTILLYTMQQALFTVRYNSHLPY